MKKEYICPCYEIIDMDTEQMLASSGDVLTGVSISDDILDDVTFGARENDLALDAEDSEF